MIARPRKATDFEVFEQAVEKIPAEALQDVIKSLRDLTEDCARLNKGLQAAQQPLKSRAQWLEQGLKDIQAGTYNPRKYAGDVLEMAYRGPGNE